MIYGHLDPVTPGRWWGLLENSTPCRRVFTHLSLVVEPLATRSPSPEPLPDHAVIRPTYEPVERD